MYCTTELTRSYLHMCNTPDFTHKMLLVCRTEESNLRAKHTKSNLHVIFNSDLSAVQQVYLACRTHKI